MKLLEVEAMNVYYGGIHAVKNVSFYIKKKGNSCFNRSKWCG